MRFAKWQGLGNDYIVVPEDALPTGGLSPAQAHALCDRHFGIGGDGILVVGGATDDADATMVIHNPDGSHAEMCGNGIRMVALWLVAEDRVTPEADGSFTIATAGGHMRPRVLGPSEVRVDMGQVRTSGVETVQLGDGSDWTGRIVDVGNPHFVIQASPDDVALPETGPALERHERFPNRTNVEFVESTGPSSVRMRVWERGVGETLACGTGACAVGVTAVLDMDVPSPVTVTLPGGDLVIDVDDDLHVHMTGPAREIYRGEVDLGALEQRVAKHHNEEALA